MLIANDFINALPKGETPEETRGYEGFFHVHHLSGSIEESVVELIIRDHNKKKFEKRKALIAKITQKFLLFLFICYKFTEFFKICRGNPAFSGVHVAVADLPELLRIAI